MGRLRGRLVFVGYFHLLSLLVVAGQFVAMLFIGRERWPAFAEAASRGARRLTILGLTTALAWARLHRARPPLRVRLPRQAITSGSFRRPGRRSPSRIHARAQRDVGMVIFTYWTAR